MDDPDFICVDCGEEVEPRRRALGYLVCLGCGERQARQVVRCVAPLHKSNYMLISKREDLVGLNNKGGLVK